MTVPLILSVFPGIGLLDRAFEEEGFCVVRGPDLLWGGDIHNFHPPAGRFDGVIGGPPCQAFSSLQRLVEHNRTKARAAGNMSAYREPENLIPEFECIVAEAAPGWFLMENVDGAPIPCVDGYVVDPALYDNRVAPWPDGIGGEQSRRHRFSFGTRDGRPLAPHLEVAALERARWSRRVLASGGYVPVALEGGNHEILDGRPARDHRRPNGRMSLLGRKDTTYFREACRLQGLPDDWDLPGFTVAAKVRAIGNGVPIPMGRAVARAVRQALGLPLAVESAGGQP